MSILDGRAAAQLIDGVLSANEIQTRKYGRVYLIENALRSLASKRSVQGIVRIRTGGNYNTGFIYPHLKVVR